MPANQTFGPEMGVLDLIASVTGSLAWPALIGFTIYTYRKPITRVLVGTARMVGRMNSLKWGEFEIANRAVREAKQAVEEKADAVEDQISQAPPDQASALYRELADLKLQAARLEAAQSAIRAAKNTPSEDSAQGAYWFTLDATKSGRSRAVVRAMVTELGGPEFVLDMDSQQLRRSIDSHLQDLSSDQLSALKADNLLDENHRATARLVTRTRGNARAMLGFFPAPRDSNSG